ncbi:Thaumatin domain-containing protein (plasmid) [Legionella adelaidensis]|uniref:Thaumatin domain-containing protein n=1 Tax=Legionella adelaidensis TaxID=45056 RepID=A0A0W0R3M8_9GAMM|nr:thaumatin family protein [Legionella adelaidensis]KTC65668.1 Thaumatin domain-containing protein [Legionella adelaidensis]VEH85136.1 Thaumatin domain-containing protein [Legionella adelaidensis]
MNNKLRSLFFLALFNFSLNAWAIAPVSWILSPAKGFPDTILGTQSVVTYVLRNNLSANVKLSTLAKTVGGNFTIHNLCNNVTLKPKGTCKVIVSFVPKAANVSTFQLIYSYNGKQFPLPPLKAVGKANCTVRGTTVLPLPTQTYLYADNVVKFVFTNECASGTPKKLGAVNVTSSNEAAIVKPASYDTCSNSLLANGKSCFVMASVSPRTLTKAMTIQASVLAETTTVNTETSAEVITNQQATHHVQFVNQCNFDVWYGIANGAGGIYSPDPNLIKFPNGAPPSAYYLPKQVEGQRPSVIILPTTVYKNGAIWPRTGCKMVDGKFICTTGTCATMDNTATCKSSGDLQQPIPPYTKFEFTIETNPGQDGVYDVSVINGFTVPVEIKAFGPPTDDPFNCTGAGALIQPEDSRLHACPWVFDPVSLSGLSREDFQWVTPGAELSCETNDPNCGRSYDVSPPNNPAKIVLRAAPFLGYTTVANYFGYKADGQWGTPNLYTKYGIASPLPNTYGTIGGQPADWGSLFACTPTSNQSADSCYLDAAGPRCCGCIEWENEPVGSATRTASSKPCVNTNDDWTSAKPSLATADNFTIQKGVLWLKAACPTAYSYQFDDKSSSFQCNKDGEADLYTSYQITFCPGGVTGKPGSADEGRGTPPP